MNKKTITVITIILVSILAIFTYKPFIHTNLFFIENLKYEKIYISLLYNLAIYFLYKSTVYDIKYKEIEDTYTVPVLILGLLTLNYQNVLLVAGILVSLRYISAFILKKEAFGEADIIILSGISGFYSNILSSAFIFFIASILSIIYFIIKKDREIPFLPFIMSGMVIFNIFNKELLKLIN